MRKFRCRVCGHIYNPAENNNIPFEDLPEDWKCPVCGAAKSEFEMIHFSGEEDTGGEAQEKHVPVLSQIADGKIEVKIGAIPHPMIDAHYIVWVELYDGSKKLKHYDLKPGEEPKAIFENVEFKDTFKAISFCNLHGLWESK